MSDVFNKCLVITKRKGGHTSYVFCPNKDVVDLTAEYINNKGGKVVAIRNYSDTKYLEVKINVRTTDLKETIEVYREIKHELRMSGVTRQRTLRVLLTSIEGQISALFGLIRRVEKKGYNIDISVTKQIIDQWLEEEDY